MNELTKEVEELMASSVQEARDAGAESVVPIHLFIAMLAADDGTIPAVFRKQGVDPEALKELARDTARVPGNAASDLLRVSNRVRKILSRAQARADQNASPLSSRYILIALLDRQDPLVGQILATAGVSFTKLREELEQEESPEGIPRPPPPDVRKGHPKSPILDRFTVDYTARAVQGALEPLIGRRQLLKEIVRTLLRKSKRNVILVGDPGVGKTALVEGLAEAASAPNASSDIRDFRIVELQVAALVGAAKHVGDLEELAQKLIAELTADPDLILFIDEIHTIVGAGAAGRSNLDLANMLKTALAREDIRVVGATTHEEYRKYILPDGALSRRFQMLAVEEPSEAEAKEILLGVKPMLEAHHNVQFEDDAVEAAVRLTARHLPDRRLPDKARDALDQAAANKRFLTLSNRRVRPASVVVTRDDVAQVVAHWAGIPAERVSTDENQRLLAMEEHLRKRVIGQEHAVSTVAKTIRTAMAGLARPGRPYGVFCFLGPSGVGKTELAKATAEFLFGDEKALLRFDMSEFHDRYTVTKLIGPPPGYVGWDEGGQLTNAVRRRPYSVVLFDEIEKAHESVADIFLSIFDDARLTDNHQRVVDFSHTVIVLTSNLGLRRSKDRQVGFGKAERDEEPIPTEQEARQLLMGHFRPELVNRISHVVYFQRLGPKHVRPIIDKVFASVQARALEKGIEVRMTPSGYELLARKGFDPVFGARGLERIIEEQIATPLGEGILGGKYDPGSVVEVVGAEDRLEIRQHPNRPQPQ